MFDTRIAILVRDDLPMWQRLNVTAFLATGIAGAAPDAMGAPYVDAAGHRYASLCGQPILVFESSLAGLQAARRIGVEREMLMAPYVFAMFSTGHDEANRQAFLAEDVENMDLVGLALRGSKKAIDKATKGLRLHP
ncbi:MAG: DUF2000 family protein [Herbaspirillum sp.]|nr:DUF2000 family protein [Herbaspirillum sp. ASV7]MBV8624580.1 DUF2000 family protein [Herbaspirillum sp.]